jgi:O-antigen/teichoic acid export membrane protein
VVHGLTPRTKTLQARIVSGSVVLLLGSGLTTATNLAYNIIVARYLGPGGFGQATVVYTLLTILSAVTLSFQIVSSKAVAQQNSMERKAAAYRGFHRSAWQCGFLVALVLFLFRHPIAEYLNLSDPVLISLIAVGCGFYIPLGSRRGFVQGAYKFRRLAINLVAEGVVRLGGSYLLILAGYGVRGVIAANAAAEVAAYLELTLKARAHVPNPLSLRFSLREAGQALVFFSGQVLINNCDIVLVEHFFPAREAGLYAAVAMVGRVIFTFCQAVVNSTFPLVAGTGEEERRDLRVIATSLLMILGGGSVLALGLRLTPAWIWASLFGSDFRIAGRYDLSYLLALYAVTTVVYALSAVIITYEMSYKITNASWVQLAFSGGLILAICSFHVSLREVILVRMDLLTCLLVFVALPFFAGLLGDSRDMLRSSEGQPVRLLRQVSEDEVIAEFLKSDFNSPVFQNYRKCLCEIVANPDFNNSRENATRRALLFLRHRSLWREIPSGTEWFEATLREPDLDRISAFPRAHWRKLADGDLSVTAIANHVQKDRHLLDEQFAAKITDIGNHLLLGGNGFGAVILLGLNQNERLTVLDGNHRLVAALLSSPRSLEKLRFVCGLSPRMEECCWYTTNPATLFRYGKNMIAHALRDPEAELARLLQDAELL